MYELLKLRHNLGFYVLKVNFQVLVSFLVIFEIVLLIDRQFKMFCLNSRKFVSLFFNII